MTDRPNEFAPLTPVEARIRKVVVFIRSPLVSMPALAIGIYVFISEVPDTARKWDIFVLALLFVNFVGGILDMLPRMLDWLLVACNKMLHLMSTSAEYLKRAAERVERVLRENSR